jgi:hypothetical protein
VTQGWFGGGRTSTNRQWAVGGLKGQICRRDGGGNRFCFVGRTRTQRSGTRARSSLEGARGFGEWEWEYEWEYEWNWEACKAVFK